MRGYFLGVTIVAIWSALIVGAGALLLDVPLAGTIAVVTFLGGYVPYIGAWIAGGCLFGTVGLVLAAPLLSAAVRIKSDLSAPVEADTS